MCMKKCVGNSTVMVIQQKSDSWMKADNSYAWENPRKLLGVMLKSTYIQIYLVLVGESGWEVKIVST